MAPEYALRGNYSVKSDAFSFGITVLEIITGRKNSAIYNGGKPDDLLDTVSVISLLCLVSIVVVTHCGEVWLDHGDNQPTVQVWQHWEAGTVAETVDPCMDGSFPEGDVLRCIHVALLCVQGDPAARPAMSSVVMMLGGDTITLQAPSKPMIFEYYQESLENE